MARRARIDLMTTGIPQTGNGNAFDFPGGEGVFVVSAKSGAGAVTLQQQAPDGSWYNITQYAATTDISITAAGKSANFRAPAGPMRAAAGAETGVVCFVLGIPQNVAG